MLSPHAALFSILCPPIPSQPHQNACLSECDFDAVDFCGRTPYLVNGDPEGKADILFVMCFLYLAQDQTYVRNSVCQCYLSGGWGGEEKERCE